MDEKKGAESGANQRKQEKLEAHEKIRAHTTEHEKDYEPTHDTATLKKKIEFLEEELVRKDQAIENLRKENDLLFKAAMKRAEDKAKDKEFSA